MDNRIVYKFDLNLMGVTELELPIESKVVRVGMQGKSPKIWIEVDPSSGYSETVYLKVYGTGQPINDNYFHIGSMEDGPYIWHVYKKGVITYG